VQEHTAHTQGVRADMIYLFLVAVVLGSAFIMATIQRHYDEEEKR